MGHTPERLHAILAATLELLREVGYERLTIDAVAAKARASKATIYRHWEDKAALTVDAIGHWPGANLDCPDTGSLRGDVLKTLRMLRKRLASSQGELLAGLLQATQRDPVLAEALRGKTHCHAVRIYRTIIERAVARGEITGCADPELILTVAPAVIFYRHLFSGDPITDNLLIKLTDNVLLPLLQRQNQKAQV